MSPLLRPARLLLLALLLPLLALAGPRHSKPAAAADQADLLEAARLAGLEPAEFMRTSRGSRDLHLDDARRPFFACDNVAGLGQTGPDNTPYTSPAPYPLEQTFLLHSRPGAAKVIYLDFTGHTTTGTPWNTNYAAGADITTPPFDTDGNPADFSAAERTAIQDVWRRVAEDYAAWDVDVTTEHPGIEALRRTSQGDSRYGVRVVIGGSSTDWLGANAGGVAYISSFPVIVAATASENDTPVFVFPAQLANASRYIGEACSHEVGHTLGLYHSGQTNGTEYYAGHADWAPIMGTSYFKDVTQWTRHDYPLANNSQDQIDVISGKIPRLVDEFGSNSGSSFLIEGNTLTAGGVIADRDDTDWFRFSAGAGTVNFDGLASAVSPDLKLSLSLVDTSGAVLATSGDVGMGATLSAVVPGGDYFVVVDGIGTGDALTAYTDYASLGRYGLFGSWTSAPPPPNQPPIASTQGTAPVGGTVPLTVQFDASHSTDADGAIVAYLWNFGDGATSTATSPSHVYTTVGDYVATLTVTDNQGATGTASVTVSVTPIPNQAPTASTAGTTPLSGITPLTVQFVGSNSSDTDGAIVSYLWDFGDGAFSNQADPTHAYPVAGTYLATLTVTDDAGATGTASVTITVSPLPPNQPPVASTQGTTPTNGFAPLTVQFVGTSSYDPDGSVVAYSWDFGDGATSNQASPSHAYAATGTYMATLSVTDNRGGMATASVTITVADVPVNQPPVAATTGTTPTSGNAPLAVQFVGGNSFDPDGTIASYAWNFGDGTTSNQANPTHTYAAAGNYTATLTVTDNLGAAASVSLLIAVATPPPAVYSHVTGLALAWKKSGGSAVVAQATVTITDQTGAPLQNASVTVSFSGLTGGSVAGTTNRKGEVVIGSAPLSSSLSGTVTATVSGVALTGYPYYPAANTATSATIAR